MKVTHPGIALREEVIKPHGLTVTQAAELLEVTRPALSNVLNAKADISTEMALRISEVFGGRPNIWLLVQMDYNLQEVTPKIKKLKLKRIKLAPEVEHS